MTGWATAQLGDLVDVLDSRRVPVSAAERAKRPGSIPYYGATGPVGSIDRALFDEPLLLLGEDGVGFFDNSKSKAYLIDGPAWVNNHAHVLRARDGVERRWLLHYLNQFDYEGYANGTTRLKLTQGSMRSMPVPLPPLDEQHRIVAVLEDHLSRLDAGVAYLQTAHARGRAWRQRSRDEQLRMHSFAECLLADLVERVEAGRSFGGAAPPAGPDEWGVLRVSAMTWGEFRAEENKAVPAVAIDPRWEVRKGDVLVSRANTSEYVGAPVLVPDVRPRLVLSDKSLRLVPVAGVDAAWLVEALASSPVRRQITALASGTKDSMRNISQANLLSVRLPWTDSAGQRVALESTEAARESAARLSNALKAGRSRAAALRRSLLTAAFAGRL